MGVVVQMRSPHQVPKVVVAPFHPDKDAPLYRMKDAARFVGMHASTLRYWLQDTPSARALIEAADPSTPRLSFNNLLEAHILQITKGIDHPIARTRKAIETLRARWPESRHPLLEHEFLVLPGCRDLFLRELTGRKTQVTNLTLGGQSALPGMLDRLLKRITKDASGRPTGLLPMNSERIVIDLNVSGGQPVVKGTGVLASRIAKRHKAGDPISMIAEDYEIKESDVEEAIRYIDAA